MGKQDKSQAATKPTAKLALVAAILAFLPGMQGRTANFEERILVSHNQERAAIGMPPMQWDAGLAERAQAWADHLVANNKFEHSPNVPGRPLEGENIWGGTRGAFFPEDMVDLWIAEKAYFVRGVFPANSSTGRVQDVSHYTQIVWRGTGRVGCAISQGPKEEVMVCRYSQPGNVLGVHPLTS